MSARPPAWRTGLLLLLMVVFLAAVGWFGLHSLISPVKPATSACVAQTVTGTLTSDQVTVHVYNGGNKRGLASSIQTKLKGAGFNVPTAGNYSDTVLQTTIIGGTADAPEVQIVAAFFPDSTIKADARTDHTVDVLVGDTFGTFNAKAPTSISVNTAVICQSSTSASPGSAASPEPATPTSTTSTGKSASAKSTK